MVSSGAESRSRPYRRSRSPSVRDPSPRRRSGNRKFGTTHSEDETSSAGKRPSLRRPSTSSIRRSRSIPRRTRTRDSSSHSSSVDEKRPSSGDVEDESRKSLVVTNLTRTVTEEHITEIFGSFGDVKGVNLVKDSIVSALYSIVFYSKHKKLVNWILLFCTVIYVSSLNILSETLPVEGHSDL